MTGKQSLHDESGVEMHAELYLIHSTAHASSMLDAMHQLGCIPAHLVATSHDNMNAGQVHKRQMQSWRGETAVTKDIPSSGQSHQEWPTPNSNKCLQQIYHSLAVQHVDRQVKSHIISTGAAASSQLASHKWSYALTKCKV